MGSEHNKQR